MKDIRPIRGKYYIADLVSQGEHEHQDFKYSIPDAPKIAHSISAFANNDGGRLLIGVKDNGVVAGVRNEEDIYVVEQAALRYCDPPQEVTFTGFLAEGGALVIRVEIPKAARRPVMSIEASGKRKAYYRVADENLPASPLMVEAWRRKESAAGGDTAGAMFSDTEMRLLNHIDNRVGLSLEEAMKRLHISEGAARDAFCRLYAASLVDFAYIDGAFRIISVNDLEPL